ncbi:DEAD/DEAH box helicase [Cohnella suwonensis]|uniref:DEAD/DEAH box helicase n=1 Tax=Cohnella suwonensis TaxID=696072 RepID=A0ABW0LXG6_9BACL
MSLINANDTIHIRVVLGAYGDALIHGYRGEYDSLPGTSLKHHLFAWHEESFYGTELEVRRLEGLELVLLPAEMVIPFFGKLKLLRHVDWEWDGTAAKLVKAAAFLSGCVDDRGFVPSYDAFRHGKLQWTWDDEALSAGDLAVLRAWDELARDSDGSLGGPDEDEAADEDGDFMAGLRSAFSASVFHSHYGTETTAADLRREHPLLFAKSKPFDDGWDEKEWLVGIGWKADHASFRPALQLLEPDEDDGEWRVRLLLQDKRDPSATAAVRLSEDGEAFGSWPGAWTDNVRQRSANWLERLRAVLPAERFALAGRDVFADPLDDEEAWRFLTADSQRLLEAGWHVLLPAWWEAASRKKPRLRAKVGSAAGSGEAGRAGGSLFGLDSLIDFDWRIAIGDVDLTEAEFAQLVARNERLVRFRGQWIELDPALLSQIRKAMASVDRKMGLSFQDVLQLHLLGGSDFNPDAAADSEEDEAAREHRIRLEVELNGHLAQLIGQLNQQDGPPRLPVPAGLRAELREYQREGFSWLGLLRRFGLGACLADDMGLGKTVQLIAYLLHLRDSAAESIAAADGASLGSPSLIVCPTSVLGNWQKELSRFAPSLRVMLHYGNRRLSGEDFAEAARQADVVLTSYATCSLDQETLQNVTWASLSLDEAQNIKNAQTKQSSVVRTLQAKHRIALTGTPIENRLSELWSLYDFMNPGYLGSLREFNEKFASSVERDRDEGHTAELQRLIKPFMLRRKKKDPAIQLDLPDKNEMKTYVNLTAEQGALYEQAVKELMEKMQKLEGIERKGAILAALTQLKQLCDHPMLLTKEKLPEAGDGADEWDAIPEVEGSLAGGSGDGEDLDAGSTAVAGIVSRSAKLERLLAMVKELREEGDRCLIFTQYVGMGEMLKFVLERELGEPALYLNGSTSKTARDRMVERFQSGEDGQPAVFILSLKAGGVGLNLTAANHVFHFDRWWNPAVENQATDRAYRMGQTRDVQVHKFISLGTLEERIDEMLESKTQLSDNVISSSEGWITELSTDELKDLFALRREFVG